MPVRHSFSTLISIGLMTFSAWASADHHDHQHDNGALRQTNGSWQIWHENSKQWTDVDSFFEMEIDRLNGPTYGTRAGNNYPPYDSVKEWETLIDKLADGRTCPMVFFHKRWRRLPDVLALDDRLRNYGGCKDVFN